MRFVLFYSKIKHSLGLCKQVSAQKTSKWKKKENTKMKQKEKGKIRKLRGKTKN